MFSGFNPNSEDAFMKPVIFADAVIAIKVRKCFQVENMLSGPVVAGPVEVHLATGERN